jgi:hypothetical protein
VTPVVRGQRQVIGFAGARAADVLILGGDAQAFAALARRRVGSGGEVNERRQHQALYIGDDVALASLDFVGNCALGFACILLLLHLKASNQIEAGDVIGQPWGSI